MSQHKEFSAGSPHSRCFANRHMTPEEFGVWDVLRAVSHSTGTIYFDGEIVATYFAHTGKNTIYRVVKSLVKKGWLLVQAKGRNARNGLYMATQYQPLSHEEWAEVHLGECVVTDPQGSIPETGNGPVQETEIEDGPFPEPGTVHAQNREQPFPESRTAIPETRNGPFPESKTTIPGTGKYIAKEILLSGSSDFSNAPDRDAEESGQGGSGGDAPPPSFPEDEFKRLLRKLYRAGRQPFDGKNRDCIRELMNRGFLPCEILSIYEDHYCSLPEKDRKHAPTRFCLGGGETLIVERRIAAFITSTAIMNGIELSEDDVESYILPALPEGRDCWFQLNGAWQLWIDDQIQMLLDSFRQEHAAALVGIAEDSDAERAYRKEHFRGAVEIENFLPVAPEYLKKARSLWDAACAKHQQVSLVDHPQEDPEPAAEVSR